MRIISPVAVTLVSEEGGQLWIFPVIAEKIFPQRDESGEIWFCPLETKKLTFLAKNVMGKC